MHRMLAAASRCLNRISGGRPGESLCGRFARLHGHDCLFCRLIGLALRDPDHCWAQRLWELRKSLSRP